MNQAYEIPSFYLGVFPADIDLSAYQFKAVGIRAAANVVGANGAALVDPSLMSGPMIGILQNKPQAGEAGTLMVHGISKAVCQGSVAIGDILSVNASGKLQVASTGEYGVAQALMAGVANEVISVALIRNGKQ